MVTAKRTLQEIWMAETKAAAELAFDAFIESYTPKYAKAADCLSKDRDTLLAFYDFPAEHWKHLRTASAIPSSLCGITMPEPVYESLYSGQCEKAEPWSEDRKG